MPSTVRPNSCLLPRLSRLEVDPPVAFASRLAEREGNSKKPIYQIHKWWARRLGSVFRSILLAATTQHRSRAAAELTFYEKNEFKDFVVLDPFVGGGTSVVEAAKCGASVIGVDIDPVACFITAKELGPWDEIRLRKAFGDVERKVRDIALAYYRTTLPDGRKGTLIYSFWVDVITCPHCKKSFDGHPHYQLFRSRTNKRQTVICAPCGSVAEVPLAWKSFCCNPCGGRTQIEDGTVGGGKFHCPGCGEKSVLRNLTTSNKRIPQRLFAVEVLVDSTGERVFKKADKADIDVFNRAAAAWDERLPTDKFVPTEAIPVEDRDDARPLSYGYRSYRELFNARQLLCLSMIAEAISEVEDVESRELLAVAFSDCLAANNMFCFFAFDYRKLTPLFGLHAYTKVSRPVENNVWGVNLGRGAFSKCVEKVIRGKRYADAPFEYRYCDAGKPGRVSTGERISYQSVSTLKAGQAKERPFAALLNRSSESLTPIAAKTVDMILTDPPYYNNLPYSELSDFYHVWLRRLDLASYPGNELAHTPLAESLYVRNEKNTPREHDRYCDGLTKALAECSRVLKDEGMLVFTFHHNEATAWAALASAVVAAGFTVTNAFPVRSEGQSRFHSYEGSLKWDVVFCCRKRSPADSERYVASLDGRGTLPIAKRARRKLRTWVQKLKRHQLQFGDADAKSLRYGLVCMYLSRRLRRNADVASAFHGIGKHFAVPPDRLSRRK